tara:strand:- start:882 stop:1337 length:456 start_codon:yes stop_codon:yes gene_type:complete
MPFVKLDCGILNSTLWIDRAAREIFITALLMAEPFEVRSPLETLNVYDIKPAQFKVPPGWYGFVPAAGPGIVRMAGLDRKEGMEALERLGAPESESRSPEYDGRRMVRISGGYIILNFTKYREKDSTTAERSKRWRERQKIKEAEAASRVS